jgi:HsdM N-terminal domain
MFEQAFKNIDDVLRKEARCTTELDYTEQTSWLLFLKYLDDLERDKTSEAALDGKKYTNILDKPYQWENWAAPKGKDGKLDHNKALTGDDLRDFVNAKLFPYLHKFQAEGDRPQHPRIQNWRNLRRDQEQDSKRLQPARDHRPHRRTALPLPDREARTLPPL